MATKLSSSSLVLCVLAMCAVNMTYAASSSSSNNAPAPSVDCSNLILAMADCLSYVTNGSTVPTPEGTCCSALKNVLKTAPQCLFEAFKSGARFGVVLNVTKALDLPAACKVSASSVDNYGLTEAPAAPPAAGSLPLESSPTPTSGSAAPGSTGPIGELSPTTAPSPGNAASAFFLISAMFLFLCLSIAQSIMQLKLTDNDLREIKEEKITDSLWKPSKEEYSAETSSNKLYQRKRLYTFKYSEGKSMQEHIDDFNKMIYDVGVAGIEVEDVDQALILLASVPPSNNNLCDAILYGRPDFSVKNVKELLIKMENDKLLSGLRNCTERKEKSGDSTNVPIEGFDDSDASSNSIVITGDTGNEQILDSNSSYHMTPNQRFSSSYKKQEIKVKLGSRRKIPIEGKREGGVNLDYCTKKTF